MSRQETLIGRKISKQETAQTLLLTPLFFFTVGTAVIGFHWVSLGLFFVLISFSFWKSHGERRNDDKVRKTILTCTDEEFVQLMREREAALSPFSMELVVLHQMMKRTESLFERNVFLESRHEGLSLKINAIQTHLSDLGVEVPTRPSIFE